MQTEKFLTHNITGILHLDIYKDGVLIQTEEHNLIVDHACRILAQCIGYRAPIANKVISLIKFSTGNLPVGKTKTALDGTVYSKAIDSVTYDPSGAPDDIQFNFSLGSGEFNGNNIWQFGLFNADNVMFSMLSRNPTKAYPIEKDSSTTISGWWKIQFRNLSS